MMLQAENTLFTIAVIGYFALTILNFVFVASLVTVTELLMETRPIMEKKAFPWKRSWLFSTQDMHRNGAPIRITVM